MRSRALPSFTPARPLGGLRDLPPLAQHGEAPFHGAHQLAGLGRVVPLRLALGQGAAVAGQGGLVVGDGGLEFGKRRRGRGHGVGASAGCSRRRAPPGMNSIPAASSARWIALSVTACGPASPRSNRFTVVKEIRAASARSLTPQPKAARAIRHCVGVTIRLQYSVFSLDATCAGAYTVSIW